MTLEGISCVWMSIVVPALQMPDELQRPSLSVEIAMSVTTWTLRYEVFVHQLKTTRKGSTVSAHPKRIAK